MQGYMYYVYILQSLSFPMEIYVGFTTNLENRLKAHNSSDSKHTSKFQPWQLITYTAFKDKLKAQDFEKYLKSGSGRVFRKKHYL